jgi:hypothetical protein
MGHPARPGADPRAAAVAAQHQLQTQQQQAEGDQDQREQGGLRPVEDGGVLLEDRGGQGRVVEQLERAVLRQQVEAHEQRTAEDSRADRGESHPCEHAPAVPPE